MRDRLCVFHSKGERDEPQPGLGGPPPQGSAFCSACRREQEELASRESGTSSAITLSSSVSMDDYLATVKNPEARRILAERREQELLDKQAETALLTEMDWRRDFTKDFDHASTIGERRKAVRRYMRAARGPSWD